MTITTPAPVASSSPSPLRQAMAGEWIKLTSVRSHKVTLATFAILSVGITILVAAVNASDWSHVNHAGFDPTNQGLSGLAIGQLAIGVLGALVITGEYSNGSIRSTLAAVPHRPRMLAAKAAVFGAAALVAGEAVTWLSFFAGQAASGPAPHASLGQPGVLRAVVLTGAFLPLLGLFSLGIGTIVRNVAGAIAIYVGVLFILPIVLAPLHHDVASYLPLNLVGDSVASTVGHPILSPGVAFALMVLYAVAALGAGLVVLIRRDA